MLVVKLRSTARAITSVGPPGGNGTTIFTVSDAQAVVDSIQNSMAKNLLIIISP
jgi:hypothetical protein